MLIEGTHTNAGIEQVGGKGYNLLRLTQSGYPVPAFVILPVDFFDGKDEAELREAVKQELPGTRTKFSDTQLFAVRSSAVAEDSEAFSFAGQFKTVLNVSQEQLADSIIDVWRSANGAQLDAYKAHASAGDIAMAVIVQEMIPATVAGVAFGIDPMTGQEVQTINAVHGLGESLVSGDANADNYRVKDGRIIDQQLTGIEPVLNEPQLMHISGVLQSLSELYGKPQDIEFAYVDEEFYLLQSRPVTVKGGGQKIVWDNSNIIESYPGLTLPLTFSFIEKMYEAVYVQLSKVLGITDQKIAIHRTAYAQMLGLLNGRVYYNLNSWYQVLSLLPGYELNAEFMERMMGVKDKPNITVARQNNNKLQSYWEVLRAARYLVKNISTIRKQKETFIRDFEKIYHRFKDKNYYKATEQEILKDYHEFEQMMVQKWKAPLVNDFFAMIYFGVLQKMCVKYFPEHKDIHNQLISGSKDIVTTEPIQQLPLLVSALTNDPVLLDCLLNNDPADTWQLLQQPEYAAQLKVVNAYIEKWGERCIAELKLETITYTQEPWRLIGILKSYALNNYEPVKGYEQNDVREEAEKIVQKELGLKPVKKVLFNHVLRNARYLVSNRENLRYYRTKGFGMVRRMMLAIGWQLHEQEVIEATRDVFYLTLDEIEAVANDKMRPEEVRAIVDKRKEDYRIYEQLPLPERVETYGMQDKIVMPQAQAGIKNNEGQITGIPCSAGVVQAKVKLLHYADELDSLNGQVMATYATDPGWVVLFPSASGILTERGSLLSHAAIVSREMGIPCIVGIEGLMDILKDGDEIIIDGSTGVVKIIKPDKPV